MSYQKSDVKVFVKCVLSGFRTKGRKRLV